MTTDKLLTVLEDIKTDVHYSCHCRWRDCGDIPAGDRIAALDEAIAAVKRANDLANELETICKEDDLAKRVDYLETQLAKAEQDLRYERSQHYKATASADDRAAAYQAALRATIAEAMHYAEVIEAGRHQD